MPSKHSKNSGDKHHFTYHEKSKSGIGSIAQRVGTDSQLPFGYCPLSLSPVADAVVSPSGRIYSREAILEYLLTKTQEIKAQTAAYEAQTLRKAADEERATEEAEIKVAERFAASQVGVSDIAAQAASEKDLDTAERQARKRLIDDTDEATHKARLKKVSPWIVQFTPGAAEADIQEPPKRPASPFSGRPLRAKDLVPVDLVREPGSSKAVGEVVRFLCPVSSYSSMMARDTITNQKVVLIKKTRVLMLESVAEALAYPTLRCPITGKSFNREDVIDIVPAASAFAASGKVEAKKYRPGFN